MLPLRHRPTGSCPPITFPSPQRAYTSTSTIGSVGALWHLGPYGLNRPTNAPADVAGAPGPIVGLIDSGIDLRHEALASYRHQPARLRFRRALADGGLVEEAPHDLQDGHGTTAAALIGGAYLGVVPGVHLAVVAAMPSASFCADHGGQARLAAIEAAFSWLVEAEHLSDRAGVDVICVNLSVHGPHATWLDRAIANARERAGILTFAPAGNIGPMGGPATAAAALAVGWHDEDGRVLARASGVRWPDGEHVAKPELVAPGANLPRCDPGRPKTYARADGSSFAAPLAAGAAAWLIAHDPTLRRHPDALTRRLLALGEPLSSPGHPPTRRLRLSAPTPVLQPKAQPSMR